MRLGFLFGKAPYNLVLAAAQAAHPTRMHDASRLQQEYVGKGLPRRANACQRKCLIVNSVLSVLSVPDCAPLEWMQHKAGIARSEESITEQEAVSALNPLVQSRLLELSAAIELTFAP